MSKKLIAVAAAAALALSALVAAPATAALTSVNLFQLINSGAVNSTTAAAPMEVRVPWNNAINQTSTQTDRTTTNTAIRVEIVVAAGATTAITAEGAARVIDELTNGTNKYTSASGKAEYSFTNSTSAAVTKTVYLYTTSTATSKVTIVNGASTGVYYIKGLVGPAYNVEATFPTAIGVGATANVDAKVTDVFGNADVATTAIAFPGTMTITTLGAASVVGGGTFTWNVARSVWAAQVTGSADAGAVAINLALTATSQATAGLPAPKTSAFASISNADLSGTVATLTAQVAALQAQLANSRPKATSVTKKRYNTLARKWNRANPSDRVALKK